LSDIGVPVIVTEGEKKTLALWRMATETGNGTGKPAFLPVGLAGVWSWRGTIGKRETATGEKVPEKGPIADLDLISWQDRRVIILFDADAATNPKVQAARRGLAQELTRLGAEVWIAELPAALGVSGADDFLFLFGAEKLAVVIEQAHRYEWKEDLIRNDKGKFAAILANAITALRTAPEWCGVLVYNEHALTISTTRPTPWGPVDNWADHHNFQLVNWYQRRGLRISVADANAAVETVARDQSYHPIRQYLSSLKWDKVGRLDDWLTLYLGVNPSPLARAFGAKWMISAVARILAPGCKADHCLIVEGLQGAFKSTAFRILGEPWFTDDIADLGSKDAAMATVGAWIVELSELEAMSRTEFSRIKAFMSRAKDRFRPPYGRRLIESPRQCVFVGTVNDCEYLRDETGGRRFWPVECGRIDLESLSRDKDQLWAEAVARYKKGEHWWLESDELNKAAKDEQDARYQADPWEPKIADWLETTSKPTVTTADVLQGALEKPAGQWTRNDESRVGKTLRRLRWLPHRPRDKAGEKAREGAGEKGPRRRIYDRPAKA
jgi:predicted P-loop ATPase